jgi:hypothetical protein
MTSFVEYGEYTTLITAVPSLRVACICYNLLNDENKGKLREFVQTNFKENSTKFDFITNLCQYEKIKPEEFVSIVQDIVKKNEALTNLFTKLGINDKLDNLKEVLNTKFADVLAFIETQKTQIEQTIPLLKLVGGKRRRKTYKRRQNKNKKRRKTRTNRK